MFTQPKISFSRGWSICGSLLATWGLFALMMVISQNLNAQIRLTPEQQRQLNDATRPKAPKGLSLPQTPTPGIDPAITEVSIKELSRTPRTRGSGFQNPEITVSIKNIGTRNFTSSPRQQGVLVYKDGRTIQNFTFTNLAVGQTLKFTFRPGRIYGGEFPSKFEFMITYDPDIFIDSNPNNDDANMNNNQRSLDTADH